jgi:molybdopterin-guanine dinucleotide biosynthesis protein MobB
MKWIHIVGRQNHGKTTLLVDLIGELTARGLRVGTLKHSSHVHELDAPGKDSFRHRAAGGNPAAIVTRDLIGVYLPRQPGADFYDRLTPIFNDCDLVLVEGDLKGPGPKIEVFRAAVGGDCLASTRQDIQAVVTDDPLELNVPLLPRSDLARVADYVAGV